MKLFKMITAFATVLAVLASGAVLAPVPNADAASAPIKSYGRNAVDTSFLRISDEVGENIDTDIPSKYDARTEKCITSVKTQGDYGSCWAHAALSSCESSLIKYNGYDTDVNLAEPTNA